ncbi:hypothetical protein EJ02DRAFT_127613 [Clathrospora elynae]|uniref:Uncharacterized protein n=1 Tax=Clathrospora elynae TaxID=706981 RepID=A0A6A5S493_9PLEO|nr:hypothetical protein EJ02DRAFT_127613 [Clathrospora elynae]
MSGWQLALRSSTWLANGSLSETAGLRNASTWQRRSGNNIHILLRILFRTRIPEIMRFVADTHRVVLLRESNLLLESDVL